MARRKNEFRLGRFEPKYFVDALDRALASGPFYLGEMLDGVSEHNGSARYARYLLFDEDKDPFYFELYIHVPVAGVTPETLGAVRELFHSLIQMDDAARNIPKAGRDPNEELAWVSVYPDEGEVYFRYFATIWNDEWEVHFRLHEGGKWQCLGIPSWREPGTYLL